MTIFLAFIGGCAFAAYFIAYGRMIERHAQRDALKAQIERTVAFKAAGDIAARQAEFRA